MGLPRLRADLDPHPRRRRVSLRAARRLRSRRRHAVRLRARPRLAQPDHEHDRPDLGRQRDLADPGRIALFAAFPVAFAIIIPAVYFPILVMLLSLIFRGVAFEFRYREAPPDLLGLRVLRWLADGASPKAWCSGRSSRASGRRAVSRAAASTASRRFRSSPVSPGLRLRLARCRLADPQDGGLATGLGPPPWPRGLPRGVVAMARQYLDAHTAVNIAAGGSVGRIPLCSSRADRDGSSRLGGVASLKDSRKPRPSSGRASVRHGLSRHRDQPLADDRAV